MSVRTDLPYLRRRTRRAVPDPDHVAAPPAPRAASAGPGHDLDIDLGGGAPAPTGPVSLDLDAPAAATPAGPDAPPRRHRLPAAHDLQLPTVTAGERVVLGPDDPVRHLTRAQSSFGALQIETAVPAGSRMQLGATFEIDGREGVVLPVIAPMAPDPRSPVLRVAGDGLVLNLRRIAAVRRFLIYAVLASDHRMPGGTIVMTTYGGARLEVPLAARPTYGAQALVTGYVVQGRLILRAEHDPFSGSLHQVCDAYGYTDLTWRDPSTPLVTH